MYLQILKILEHYKKNQSFFYLSYKFANISTLEAQSIMHFLENKGGYRRFLHNPPSVYNQPKVFYCASWSHTWNYIDSHSIDATLIEDPLGVIPKNS